MAERPARHALCAAEPCASRSTAPTRGTCARSTCAAPCAPWPARSGSASRRPARTDARLDVRGGSRDIGGMPLLLVPGAVDAPLAFELTDLAALPEQVADVSSVVPGKAGAGVRLGALLGAAGAHGDWITLVSGDGFSISVPRAPVE